MAIYPADRHSQVQEKSVLKSLPAESGSESMVAVGRSDRVWWLRKRLGAVNPKIGESMKNTLSLRISAKLVLSALLLSIFAVGAVFAQEVTGAVQGEVKDQSGAVVAGAAVTATNAQRSFNTTTDSKGEYRFPNLQPGSYA